jgi:hypothetical protein
LFALAELGQFKILKERGGKGEEKEEREGREKEHKGKEREG